MWLTMERKTELMMLFTILLFSIVIVLLPIFFNQPYQMVTNVDYWSHATKMQQFDSDNYIDYETDWTNLFRIEGEPKYYPLGFPILLFSMKELGDMGYYLPSLISLLFTPSFCLLLYLISRKLLGPGPGIMAAFMGACFISGSNMLGPMLPLASTLAVIFMLFAIFTLLLLSNHVIKVVLASIFFGSIFVTHRASIGALILMFPFIAIMPMMFTKNRKRFLEYFHYPLMMSLFLGAVISIVFWINLPIEDIMNLGGIVPKGFDELLGLSITKSSFLSLIILVAVSVIIFFSLPIMGKELFRSYEPIVKEKMSSKNFFVYASLLPMFFILLLLWFIYNNSLAIPTTPGAAVSLWTTLSSLAHGDYTSLVVKQILYGWHWNILPLILIIPSIYIYMKSNRNNLFLSICIGALFTIPFAFLVQDTLFDIKVQRIYFYISPFAFFIAAWGGFHIFSDKEFNKHFKKIIGLVLIISVIMVAYSSLSLIPKIPSDKINGIAWSDEHIDSNSSIASTGFTTQEARGLGQMNFVVHYGIFTLYDENQLIDYYISLDARYIFIPPEEYDKNIIVTNSDRVYKIYSNEETNVYIIER